MIVGVLKVELMLFASHSLKDKRRVVRSVKQQVRDRFNVAIAEVDHLDLHRRCALGIAAVSNEERGVHAMFDQIIDLVRGKHEVSLVSYDREFF
jgi:hypothetical protein